MPTTSFSEQEIENLIADILAVGGRSRVEALLSKGIENYKYQEDVLEAHNPRLGKRFFYMLYSHRDYDVHVYSYYADEASVSVCDIQFRRNSGNPFNPFSHFLNRNAQLTSKLERAARKHYGTYGDSVERRHNGTSFRDVFFGRPASSHNLCSNVRYYFEEVGAECLIGSELNSEGGYDFVSFRFRRHFASR